MPSAELRRRPTSYASIARSGSSRHDCQGLSTEVTVEKTPCASIRGTFDDHCRTRFHPGFVYESHGPAKGAASPDPVTAPAAGTPPATAP